MVGNLGRGENAQNEEKRLKSLSEQPSDLFKGNVGANLQKVLEQTLPAACLVHNLSPVGSVPILPTPEVDPRRLGCITP